MIAESASSSFPPRASRYPGWGQRRPPPHQLCRRYFHSAPTTASLKAKKWFLAVAVAKTYAFFVKLIPLGHIYPIATEFTWTRIESN